MTGGYNTLALAGTETENGGESEIKGEAHTGFEKRGKRGAFECGNCHFFRNGDACFEETMKAKSKQPRHANGDVVVAPDDCCKFLDRIGKG
jgi:hypothetical protein